MEIMNNIFSQSIVHRIGWTLIHFTWQAISIAILLAIILRLARKQSSNLRYAASILALILMIVAPVLTFEMLAKEQPVQTTITPTAVSPPPLETIKIEMPVIKNIAQPTPAKTPLKEKILQTTESLLPHIVLAWLAGVFILSIWYLGGWTQLQKLRKKMTAPVSADITAKLKHLAKLLAITKTVDIFQSMLVSAPTVIGHFKPVILLPASALTGLSGEQIEAILAHELAHIKRCDYLVNILQTVVEILGFYHPAVWWVSNKIRHERENCCDDIAVKITGNNINYARALATMEEIRFAKPQLAVAVTGGSLFERIKRLISDKNTTAEKTNWLPSVLAVVLILSLIISAGFAMNNKPKKVPEQKDYSSVVIKEGIGFDDVIVGDPNCTREFLISKFGQPDKQSTAQWLNYNSKYGLDFWFSSDGLLSELRFNPGFKGRLESGISMDSAMQDVFKIYGYPVKEENVLDMTRHFENQTLYKTLQFSKIFYNQNHLLFWFKGDKINQFVIYPKPQQTNNDRPADEITVYEVNKSVADFPDNDFSTPESAYAAINKVLTFNDAQKLAAVSLTRLGEGVIKAQLSDNPLSPEWIKTLENTQILEVWIWKDKYAAVIAELPQKYSSKPIEESIDIRGLNPENGKWLNHEDGRVWTIEEARAMLSADIEKTNKKVNRLENRTSSAKRLSELSKRMLTFSNDNNEKYPEKLADLTKADVNEADLKWLDENIVYFGNKVELTDPPNAVLAYDRTLLEQENGEGTNVLYNDLHVAFEKTDTLEKLGIKLQTKTQNAEAQRRPKIPPQPGRPPLPDPPPTPPHPMSEIEVYGDNSIANFLINPGAETGKDDLPSSWFKACVPADGLQMYRDTANVHSGKYSLAIANAHKYEQTVSNNWAQNIQTVPIGNAVKVNAYIKTENADSVNVCIQCWGLGDTEKMLAFTSTNILTGDNNWALHESPPVLVPVGTVKITVRAVLTGTGKVWFDDINVDTIDISDDIKQSKNDFEPQKEKTGPTGRRPTGNCSLSGKVVSAETNEPVPNALLYLFYQGTNDALFINAASDGTFEFKDIPKGPFSLKTIHIPGYQDKGYNPDDKAGDWPLFSLREGENRTNIIFKIERAYTISGKVFDEVGKPFTDSSYYVIVWRQGKDGKPGEIYTPNGHPAKIGSDGSYLIDALDGTPVYVMVIKRTNPAEGSSYPRIFYPGTFSQDEAVAINFDKDKEIKNIDIKMQKSGGLVLEGIVKNVKGQPVSDAFIVVHHRDMLFDFVTSYTDNNGKYKIDGLGPGKFLVHVDAAHKGYSRARYPFEMKSDNYVLLNLFPGATICGKLVDENGNEWQNNNGYGQALVNNPEKNKSFSQTNFRNKYRPKNSIENTGGLFLLGLGNYNESEMIFPTRSTFIVQGFIAGKTKVIFMPMEKGCFVKEILYNGQNIVDTGIETKPGDEIKDVTVVIGKNAKSLELRQQDAKNN